MRKLVLTLALALALALGVLWLQGGFDALARWAAEGQREFQNAMAGALRRLRAGETGALLGLMVVAFAYGFFHAAGPGHGKILIGGYGAASRVRLFPLAGIALAASLAQATTAVVLVYGGLMVLQVSRDALIDLGEGFMTRASMAAIALIGLWLVWRGGRGLLRLWQAAPAGKVAAPVGATGGAAAATPDAVHRQDAGTSHNADHPHEGHGEVCDTCGHRHGLSAAEVARLTGWRDALVLIGAIAIRPCTGALFLLLLTWNMGLAAAGIAGTYAMGLGTAAITVAVAALAVGARDGALIWARRLNGLRLALPVLELAAGGVVVLVAVQMLLRGF
jgi:nickel/cobalt transporter (NicO) family protein